MGFLLRWFQDYRLKKAKAAGLQIADDCRMEGLPFFGTEPYLISIGKHVLISSKVVFLTHDGSTYLFRDTPEYHRVMKFGRITVHDNCFLGYGCTILPGVSIGPNAIVAAGAVVTKDVPPNSVVGGVPAKVLTTLSDYADKCKQANLPYDFENFDRDKRGELLKHLPYPW